MTDGEALEALGLTKGDDGQWRNRSGEVVPAAPGALLVMALEAAGEDVALDAIGEYLQGLLADDYAKAAEVAGRLAECIGIWQTAEGGFGVRAADMPGFPRPVD